MEKKKYQGLILVALLVAFSSSWASDPEGQQEQEISRDRLVYPLPAPDFDLVGEETTLRVSASDTLADIGYRKGLGFRELGLANANIDAWLPRDFAVLLLPTRFVLPDAAREGIVLNTAEMRLYYFTPDGASVLTFPVSVGRGEWQTPVGETSLQDKVHWPAWYPPRSIREEYAAEGKEIPRMIPAGPDNPLGEYALNLALPGYLIHGTNRPYGIGMPVTHGCIRLHPDDIEYLFRHVDEGMKVTLVHQPYKVGWDDDVLYLEVHPPIDGGDIDFSGVEAAVARATRNAKFWVNWERAKTLATNPDGLPHPIGRRTRDERIAQR